MNRPGNQFLARARFAEDQDGHIAAGDQFHAFHHGAQAGFGADDPVGQLAAAQFDQQRLPLGFGGLAQRVDFAKPSMLIDRGGQRFEQGGQQLAEFGRQAIGTALGRRTIGQIESDHTPRFAIEKT